MKVNECISFYVLIMVVVTVNSSIKFLEYVLCFLVLSQNILI